jgi:16S rRNA processing protein RimM
MQTPPELSLIGRIGRKHGFKGALTLDIDDPGALPLLTKGNYLFIVDNEKGVPFLINDVYGHQPIVELNLIDNEDRADWCVGRTIGLDAQQHQTSSSPYGDLEGLELETEDGLSIGSIVSVEEYPAGPMLTIQRDGDSLLIPWVEEWVLGFDPETRILTIDLPEGLMNIDDIESEMDTD